MDLYILRHGIAAEKDNPRYSLDAERALTDEGRKKILRIARHLKTLGISLDMILSSPLVRARQTAEIVASVLGCKHKLRLTPHLALDGSSESLVRQVKGQRPMPKSAMLVGHEPRLSEFISTLLCGKPDLPLDLKKGGLCKLEVEVLKYGRCATLQWFVPPKLLH
jgi:phosphohistidine phosphatase